MAYVKFTLSNPPCICIPSWFIVDYMPQALGGYVKVYLYILNHYTYNALAPLSLEDVATKLNMLYSELIAALQYWDSVDIIKFTPLTQDDFELTFNFEKPIHSTTVSTMPIGKAYLHQTRPNYSPQELNIYKSEDQSITKLFYIAEHYLGSLLTPTDQQILFGLYDWLHMPIDLIEYLIDFCVTNAEANSKKINLRYIEKVALAWVDEGIMSLEQARLKTTSDKNYFKILSELGLSSQTLTSVQKEFINKWLNTYKLNMDIILEGCKRSVAQTKSPSLKYLDTILTSWHKNQVTSLQDITKLDESHQLEIQKKVVVPVKTSPKNQRFTNISSHNWDFDELEKLEREYVKRKLNGGM